MFLVRVVVCVAVSVAVCVAMCVAVHVAVCVVLLHCSLRCYSWVCKKEPYNSDKEPYMCNSTTHNARGGGADEGAAAVKMLNRQLTTKLRENEDDF